MKNRDVIKRTLVALIALACAGVVTALLLVLLNASAPPATSKPEPRSLAERVDRAIDDGLRRLEAGIELTDDDKRFLLGAARTVLENQLAGGKEITRDHWPNVPPNVASQGRKAQLYVTLIADGRTRGCVSWPDGDLLERTIAATKQAVADRRFGGAFRVAELPAARIDITLLLEPEEVTVRDLRLLGSDIEIGVHAFSLERGPKKAFFKSSVPVERGHDLKKSLELLGIEAGLGPQAYRQRTTQIRKYVTVQFAESPVDKSLVKLFHQNIPFRQADVTRDALVRALRLCGDYMVNHTSEDAVLTYLYNVSEDEKDDPDAAVALIRRLASTWLLAMLGSEFNEKTYTDSARRIIARLLKKHYRSDAKQGFGYLQIGQDANLGTAAFALLTLTEIGDENFHADERRMLLKFILAMEDTKRGCLYPVYLPDKESLFARKEIYYPGEALTALMTVYERTKNPACLALAERVFDYYVRLFDRTPRKASVSPWMSKAYTIVFLATRKRKYADFVFKMNDHLLRQQQRPGVTYADKIGAFFTGGGGGTGVFLESIVEAYRLANELGDEKRINAYRECILLGSRFVLQLQYRPENMFTARNRALALGGVRMSARNSSVRIDCVQHAASAMLKTARHMY